MRDKSKSKSRAVPFVDTKTLDYAKASVTLERVLVVAVTYRLYVTVNNILRVHILQPTGDTQYLRYDVSN